MKTQTVPVENDELDEFERWVLQQFVAAQHGTTLEDAGRASAYARVLNRIRTRGR